MDLQFTVGITEIANRVLLRHLVQDAERQVANSIHPPDRRGVQPQDTQRDGVRGGGRLMMAALENRPVHLIEALLYLGTERPQSVSTSATSSGGARTSLRSSGPCTVLTGPGRFNRQLDMCYPLLRKGAWSSGEDARLSIWRSRVQFPPFPVREDA